MSDLQNSVIKKIFSNNRGILAADESLGTIGKRLSSIHVESTTEMRRAWRNLLFTTPSIEKYIGGVILYEETLYQKTDDNQLFPEYLKSKGIVPGIKVDKGTTGLSGFPSEKITEGLDGLEHRLTMYKSAGAEFAKWRAVFKIGDSQPSNTCIHTNIEILACYAAACLEQNIVPILEPEILMDGSHSISTCEQVTTDVLAELFYRLHKHNIDIRDTILKPNMVLPGNTSLHQSTDAEIAIATTSTLLNTVPPAIPAIAFLSGGQDYLQATNRLNEINKHEQLHWTTTFSFSRALQDPVMKTWQGRRENTAEAQQLFINRARCNSLASSGKYTMQCE